jgi:hypothetical protein
MEPYPGKLNRYDKIGTLRAGVPINLTDVLLFCQAPWLNRPLLNAPIYLILQYVTKVTQILQTKESNQDYRFIL